MAVGNSVYDEIREQHANMKDKSFKEKLAYFWEYYKLHTIVTVIILVIVVQFIYSQVTAKDTALYVACVNSYIVQENEEICSDLEEYLELDTNESEVVFDDSITVNTSTESYDEYSIAGAQKMMAMVSAGTMDCVVTDNSLFDVYKDQFFFEDLTDILSEEQFEKYQDRIIYYDIPEDEYGEIPIGVDITDSPRLLGSVDKTYFAVAAGAVQTENAASFLDFMLEEYVPEETAAETVAE